MLGNLNNVNETRHIGQSNNWTPATMPKNLVTTRSAAGEMDYQNKKGTVKNNLTASYTSTTDVSESRSRYEQFLQGETPVSLTTSFNSTGNHQWNAHDELSLNKPLYLNIASDFTYTKSHNRLNAAFDQFSDTLTASQRTHSFGEGETWSGNIEATGAFNIGKKQKYLGFYIKAEHTEDDSKSAQSYNTTQYAGRQQTKLHNLNDISNRTSLLYLTLSTRRHREVLNLNLLMSQHAVLVSPCSPLGELERVYFYNPLAFHMVSLAALISWNFFSAAFLTSSPRVATRSGWFFKASCR